MNYRLNNNKLNDNKSHLIGSMANYKTLGRFINFLVLYTCIQYWVGSENILNPMPDKKLRFYAWSFVIIVAIYFILYYFLIHQNRFWQMASNIIHLF